VDDVRLILTCGLPGSGKTTLAAELWRRLEARNAGPPWAAHPIRRADLDAWVAAFEAPAAAELACFDRPLPGATEIR